MVNQIAKARYMTNGQITLPLVVRFGNGGGLRFGAQHSQSVEGWLMAAPGLKVVVPSTPADVIGLMAAAVRDDDPVMFLEEKGRRSTSVEVPEVCSAGSWRSAPWSTVRLAPAEQLEAMRH